MSRLISKRLKTTSKGYGRTVSLHYVGRQDCNHKPTKNKKKHNPYATYLSIMLLAYDTTDLGTVGFTGRAFYTSMP